MRSELYHYGIPGMKWGIRRKENDPSQPNKKPRKRRITVKQIRTVRGIANSAALAGLTAYNISNATKFSRKLPPKIRNTFNRRYWSIMGPALAMETLMVGNDVRKLYKARRRNKVNEQE